MAFKTIYSLFIWRNVTLSIYIYKPYTLSDDKSFSDVQNKLGLHWDRIHVTLQCTWCELSCSMYLNPHGLSLRSLRVTR